MIFCKHAVTKRDRSGSLEFFCSRFSWRMDVDLLEKCRSCSEYKSM